LASPAAKTSFCDVIDVEILVRIGELRRAGGASLTAGDRDISRAGQYSDVACVWSIGRKL
jgi:hypothetical protein